MICTVKWSNFNLMWLIDWFEHFLREYSGKLLQKWAKYASTRFRTRCNTPVGGRESCTTTKYKNTPLLLSRINLSVHTMLVKIIENSLLVKIPRRLVILPLKQHLLWCTWLLTQMGWCWKCTKLSIIMYTTVLATELEFRNEIHCEMK